MDSNKTEGTKNQVKGTMKEQVSKVTGNKSGELEGKLQKNIGKTQRDIGRATDS